MIVVSLSAANAVPLYDAYSQMVCALKGADVQDVIVTGRIVVRDKHGLTLDRTASRRRSR